MTVIVFYSMALLSIQLKHINEEVASHASYMMHVYSICVMCVCVWLMYPTSLATNEVYTVCTSIIFLICYVGTNDAAICVRVQIFMKHILYIYDIPFMVWSARHLSVHEQHAYSFSFSLTLESHWLCNFCLLSVLSSCCFQLFI